MNHKSTSACSLWLILTILCAMLASEDAIYLHSSLKTVKIASEVLSHQNQEQLPDSYWVLDAVLGSTQISNCRGFSDDLGLTLSHTDIRTRGVVALRGGCFEESVAILSEAYARDNSPTTGYFLGWAFLGIGARQDAVRIWREVGAATALGRLGAVICRETGAYTAEKNTQIWQLALESACSVDEIITVHSLWAGCAIGGKLWDQALEQYEYVLFVDPVNIEANYWIAWILHRQQYKSAESLPYANNALTSMNAADRKRVESRWGQFIEQSDVILLLADIHGESGQASQAWLYLKEAESIVQSWKLDYHLARQYYRESNLDLAETHFREAVRKEPRQPSPYRELGMLYLSENRPDDAIGVLRRLTMVSSDARTWKLLGDAHSQAHDCDQAQLSYLKARMLVADEAPLRFAIDESLRTLIEVCG